jgi:hypothetical protein
VRHFTASILTATAITLAATGAAFSWGAIAVDDSYGDEPSGAGYGFATEASSRQEANAGAMEACRSEGNEACAVVLTFKACGAYASSRTNFGVGAGANLGTAEKRAMADCGGPDCIVVISDCE